MSVGSRSISGYGSETAAGMQMASRTDKAALKIQSFWRSRLARRRVAEVRKATAHRGRKKFAEQFRQQELRKAEKAAKERQAQQDRAAVTIQRMWRSRAARREFQHRKYVRAAENASRKKAAYAHAVRKKELMKQRQQKQVKERAAVKIQAVVRGWLVRKQLQFDKRKREREAQRRRQLRQIEKEVLMKKLQHMEARGKFGTKQYPIASKLGLVAPSELGQPAGYLSEDAWAERRRDLADIDKKLQEIEDRRVGSRARHQAQVEAAKWEAGVGFTKVGRWRGAGFDQPRNRAQVSSFLGVPDLSSFEHRPSPLDPLDRYAKGGSFVDAFAPPELPRGRPSSQPFTREWQLLPPEVGRDAFVPPSREQTHVVSEGFRSYARPFRERGEVRGVDPCPSRDRTYALLGREVNELGDRVW